MLSIRILLRFKQKYEKGKYTEEGKMLKTKNPYVPVYLKSRLTVNKCTGITGKP